MVLQCMRKEQLCYCAVYACQASGATSSWQEQQQQQQPVSSVARMQPPIVRTAAAGLLNGATSRGSLSAAVPGWQLGVFWAGGHRAHCGFWHAVAACRQRQLRTENPTFQFDNRPARC